MGNSKHELSCSISLSLHAIFHRFRHSTFTRIGTMCSVTLTSVFLFYFTITKALYLLVLFYLALVLNYYIIYIRQVHSVHLLFLETQSSIISNYSIVGIIMTSAKVFSLYYFLFYFQQVMFFFLSMLIFFLFLIFVSSFTFIFYYFMSILHNLFCYNTMSGINTTISTNAIFLKNQFPTRLVHKQMLIVLVGNILLLQSQLERTCKQFDNN